MSKWLAPTSQPSIAVISQGSRPFAPEARIQGVLGAGRIDWALEIWSQLIDGLGIQLTIEELIVDGERAVVRFGECGVFRGPFMGAQPTGKSYELVAIEWFVIRGGLIHSRWAARDAAWQARQIGLPIKYVYIIIYLKVFINAE